MLLLLLFILNNWTSGETGIPTKAFCLVGFEPLLMPCGETGIRTPDTLLTYTRFPGVPLQPLEHLSIGIERCLHVTIHIFGYKNIFFFEHYHTILQKVLSKVEFFDYLHIVSALYSRKNALYIVIGDIFHLLNGYIIYIC